MKSGHRGGSHNPASAAKCRLELPAKAQASGGDTAGAAFSTVFCFLGMPPLPQRSSLSHLQQALTFLVPWPPAKEINASHFLSHWENCLTICRGEKRILEEQTKRISFLIQVQKFLLFYSNKVTSLGETRFPNSQQRR